ncbi:MAG: hypothetical protein M3Y59_08015 [Myxococcota bacterium]|nr:hypothetical protein [Myxococcota bacterium]
MTPPAAPPSLLQQLNVRSRRLMLILGMGLLAAMSGAIIAAPFAVWLRPRMDGAPMLVGVLLNVLVARFWLVGVLPVLGYGMGRALGLRPLSFAFGAALSGELFYLLLDVATGGLQSVVARPGLLAARVGTLALGILLTLRATRAGVRAGERSQRSAQQIAEARRAEYNEMMREAERTAERHQQNVPPATSAVSPADPLSVEKPAGEAEPGPNDGSSKSSAG